MTVLLPFSPRLDERLTSEFLAHSLALLKFSTHQSDAMLDASALRMERPELPRDPDLPLLPSKAYPRPDTAQIDAAVRHLSPPPPVEGIVERKAELDQAVIGLLGDHPMLITGAGGSGRTTLLRQIAHDGRLRKRFKRIWWLDDLEDAGMVIGLALNAPNVLRASLADQSRLAREFLEAAGVLLLVDHGESGPGVDWALNLTPTMAIGTDSGTTTIPPDGIRLVLGGLPSRAAVQWLANQSGYPESTVQPLAERVRYHPRTLRVLAALMTEDNIPPEALSSFLDDATGDPLAALYKASFEAMPEAYQALCRRFAASPRRWIEAASIATSTQNKALAEYRALTFIERRQFVERLGDTVRVVGNWPEVIPANNKGDIAAFPAILRPRLVQVTEHDSAGALEARELHRQGVAALEAGLDTDAAALLDKALTLREAEDTDHAVAETLVAQARLAYLQGDDSSAIRRLEAAGERLHSLRDQESLDVVRVALSRVYRRAGRLDAALSVLGEDAPPEDLAMTHRARHEWADAIAIYRRWIESGPEPRHRARVGLAETYLFAGQYAEAQQGIGELEDLAGGETFETLWLRALSYHVQGNVRDALEWYSHLYNGEIEIPPEWRSPLVRAYGRAMAAVGDAHEAGMLVAAEGVWYEVKLPRPVFARQRISQALAAHFSLIAGDNERAEIAARTCLQVSGERPDPEAEAIACRVLGRLAWQNGKLETALAYFEQELSARGTIPDRDEYETGVTLHNIAELQTTLGQPDRAVANYRRALSHKKPAHDRESVILTRLALRDLLFQIGRDEEALDSGQAALTLAMQRPESDLRTLGYVMALQAQVQRERGLTASAAPRGTKRSSQQIPARAESLLDQWMAHLAAHVNGGLAHSYWGVNLLATGLYLRSEPPLDDPIQLIDLAEKAVEVADQQTPATTMAWAAQRDLGQLYLRLKRWTEAYEVFAPLLDATVAAGDPLIVLAGQLGSARAAAQLGRIEDATRHFDAAEPFEPDPYRRTLIHLESADAYRAAGDDIHAAERYGEVLKQLDQDRFTSLYVDTVVTLAYTRLRLRRFGEAIDTFEEALKIAEKRSETDPALLASVLFDMASAHSTLGQFKRAAIVYRQSLGYQDARRGADRYLETLIGLARSSQACDELQSALEAYHEALQFEILKPDQRRRLLAEQAGVFARAGQVQTAIDTFKTALEIEGASAVERARLHREIGALFTRLDDHEEARAHFEAVLAAVQDEETGLTLQALGDGYRAQDKPQEALTAYQQALDRLDRATYPVEAAAVARSMGEVYLGRGEAFEALTHLESALEIERALPQQNGARIVSTLQSIGGAHELRGELEKATYRHHEALVYQDVRHEPDGYVETLRTLGRLYMQLTRFKEAAKAFEEALNTENHQPKPDRVRIDEITAALADVYRAQGRLEEAAEFYRKVTKSPAPETTRPAAEAVHKRATQSLEVADAEIARHMQTLEAAQQSWILLNRGARSDLKSLAFVRALQAKICATLGRWDDSKHYTDQMIELLRSRREELRGDDPALQALSIFLEGRDHDDAGDSDDAAECYRRALTIVEGDAKADTSLRWVIQQKTAKPARR